MQKCAQLFGVGGLRGRGLDDGVDVVSPVVVRHADDDLVDDIGVLAEGRSRPRPGTRWRRRDDQVLASVGDVEVAVFVERAEVSDGEGAVGGGRGVGTPMY